MSISSVSLRATPVVTFMVQHGGNMIERELIIILDNVGTDWPCAICGGQADSFPGPNLVTRDTNQFVCLACERKHAAELHELLELWRAEYLRREVDDAHGRHCMGCDTPVPTEQLKRCGGCGSWQCS